jgi:hypothetical protein
LASWVNSTEEFRMVRRSAILSLPAAIILVFLAPRAFADGSNVDTAQTKSQDPAAPSAKSDSPPPAATPQQVSQPPSFDSTSDVTKLRASTRERLAQIGETTDKDHSKDAAEEAFNKELRQILTERFGDLDTWEQAAKAHAATEREASAPERETTELKDELNRAIEQLKNAEKSPESLLPELFRSSAAKINDSTLSEMKDAIGSALEQWNRVKEKLDQARLEASQSTAGAITKLREDREKTRKNLTSLISKDTELDAALASATTPQTRELDRERDVNVEWEIRTEMERLKEVEAKLRLYLESHRSSYFELKIKSLTAQCEVSKRTLEMMQAHYRALATSQQKVLEKAAAAEHDRAERANDPVERYRAKRSADFLRLQAQLSKEEQELTAGLTLSLQQQTTLADEAKEDFENLRKLVEGGRSTTLVALRLTNSYRRIATEREDVVNRELAQASLQLTRYENALTEVELALLNDSREDRLELESVLAHLPHTRHSELVSVFEAMEIKHRALLEERRRVLTKLASRADETRKQVLRRVDQLDEQHAFIRTHIFWVRDAAPLSLALFVQCQREGYTLGRAALTAAAVMQSRKPRPRTSTECALGIVGLAVLPLAAIRTRRSLHRLLRHRPSDPPQSAA